MSASSKYSLLGPAFPHLGWVPAPRYLLRRARILKLIEGHPVGSVLEIGPGAGALLSELSSQGFSCQALELSAPARELSERVLASTHSSARVHAAPDPQWTGQFDYVFAFDVLEHIEQDKEALKQWASWVKPGGMLLMSVPAHMRLWTEGDEWAGHFRRYERAGLSSLMADCGLSIDVFECYGFPLSNVTEKVSSLAYRRHTIRGQEQQNPGIRQQNNDRSGTDRRPHLRLYPLLKSVPGRWAMHTFCWLQSCFLRLDVGSGYLVKAHPQEPVDSSFAPDAVSQP